MPKFLISHLAQLTRQLSYAPPARRREQIERAELLYWQTDPAINYPLAYIVFRVTGYRAEDVEDAMLTGEAVRHDLLTIVEQLSDSLADPIDSFTPTPVPQTELCKRWNVTAKTLSRYRRAGLFCRTAVVKGRKRIVYLPASVERFLAHQPQRVERARRFSRLDKDTRKAIIRRARRIARRVEVSPFQVARHLARKYNRPVETLRLFLLRHDKRRPEKAIFPEHQPPLTDKQQRAIHRLFLRGSSVADLAKRFGRGRNAIYRAINARRAAALRSLELAAHPGPTFELPDAEQVILGPALPELPAFDAKRAAAESALFVRYNFLKYRAMKLRDALDAYQPSSLQLDAIETYLRRAVRVKEILTAAGMRIVISTARKHLATAPALTAAADMPKLIQQGAAVLAQSIEAWDPAREGRFAPFLTYNLMRHFAQSPAPADAAPHAHPSRENSDLPASMNPNLAGLKQSADTAASLGQLLQQLDETERLIITRHIGVNVGDQPADEPQPLTVLAAQLQLPVERIRQIERRALVKLREAAEKIGVDVDDFQLIPAL